MILFEQMVFNNLLNAITSYQSNEELTTKVKQLQFVSFSKHFSKTEL